MIRLFLKINNEWKEVDHSASNIALNDSMINILNPLKMSTEYSKTISLHIDGNNKKVFDSYDRLDSIVTDKVDPTKAIPARIENSGNVMFEGWFAVNKVDIGNKKIEGNLYSNINVWVNILKRLTWDDFPQLLPSDFNINRYNVYRSITTPLRVNLNDEDIYNNITGQNPSAIDPARWNFHIGFAPTFNGTPSQFSSDKIVDTDGTIKDVWEGLGLTGDAKSTADAILREPSERQMLQFRSYNFKPYIYMCWLVRLIQWWCNDNPDMPNLTVDDSWANTANANWFDLVYLLPDIISDETDANVNGIVYLLDDVGFSGSLPNVPQNLTTNTYNSGSLSLSSPTDTDHQIIDAAGWINGNGKQIDYILPLDMTTNFSMYHDYQTSDYVEDPNPWLKWNLKAALCGNISAVVGLIDDNNVEIVGTEQVVASWDPSTEPVNVNVQYTQTGTYTRRDIYTWGLNKQATYTWTGTLSVGTNARPYIKWNFKNFSYSWTGVYETQFANTLFIPQYVTSTSADPYYDMMYMQDAVIPTMKYCDVEWNTATVSTNQNHHRIRFSSPVRSGKPLDMKTLWFKENTPTIFEVLLKYIKLMNLVLVYDNFTNTLRITTREQWMKEGFEKGIEDWTSKIDYGKDISFTPVSWDKKFVEFNYKDSGTDRLSEFVDKYGYTYGTKRIETAYSFNNDTKKLLEDTDEINASGEMSEYQYNLYQIKNITDNAGSSVIIEDPILPVEAFPINKKDNKAANLSNCFFYRVTVAQKGGLIRYKNKVFDSSMNVKLDGTDFEGVCITDDCQYENNNSTYCFQPLYDKVFSSTTVDGVTYNEYRDNDGIAIKLPQNMVYGNMVQLSQYFNKVSTQTDPVTNLPMQVTTPYCCLFSQPREDYFNPAAVARNSNDLWNVRWSNLIPEVYNEQNKLVTCRVYLTPSDYNLFKFNKFIHVKGVLYLVNKIIDYDPSSTKSTKVELLQVFNPECYTTAP